MPYIKKFEPIESDPQILTKLMHDLGVQEDFYFGDVVDYEGESNESALALIVIFPESASDEAQKKADEAKRVPVVSDKIKFFKQTIDNACGLIAIIHCVLNTVAAEHITHESILYDAMQSNGATRSSEDITKFLEGSQELEIAYRAAVNLGETEVPDNVLYHYTVLVGSQDRKLYELDGERLSPLARGSCSDADHILKDSRQIKEIVDSFRQDRDRDYVSVYKLKQMVEVIH